MPRLMVKPLLKIGGIAAFVLLLLGYFWWSMRIPPPREADRVTHRDGIYSIIAPRGWEISFDYAGRDQRYLDTLELRIPTVQTRDRRIFLGRMRGEPDLTGLRRERQIDAQFQGQPAHVFRGRTRLEYYWRALFQRGGEWYELVFWMPYEEDVPNTRWMRYLESFRVHASPATAPATAPAISSP